MRAIASASPVVARRIEITEHLYKDLAWLIFVDRDASLVGWAFELDLAGNQSEKRMVFADTDAGAGIKFGASLANENMPCLDDFAAVFLDAQPVRLRIAAVSR